MAARLTRPEIIVIAIGLAIGGAWWLFRPSPLGPVSTIEVARIAITVSIVPALEKFQHDVGRYPTIEEGLLALVHAPAAAVGWNGPYLERLPIDPWGRQYQYSIPGSKGGAVYDVWSVGADGKISADDIGNWKR